MSDSTIRPIIPDASSNYDISELFDKKAPRTNAILPQVNSIVFGENNVQYRVISRDITTLTYELVPIVQLTQDELAGAGGIISYNNDYFRLFYDPRTKPYRVTIASRAIAFDASVTHYKLKLFPYDEVNSRYISRYYDSSGNYVSDSVPMTRIENGVGGWTCSSCYVLEELEDNQSVALEIFNEYGVQIDTIRLFSKKALISNDSMDYIPKIVSAKVISSQMLPDKKTVYLVEKQSFSSLNLGVRIVYEDNTAVDYPIDGRKVFLYGEEDFIASYSGQKQKLAIKYYLSENENNAVGNNNITQRYIDLTFDACVVNNEILDVVKVSVIPVWSSVLYGWVLHYRLYGVNNNFVMDVTPYVSIINGEYDKTNFSTPQSFTIKMDLFEIDPVKYPLPTNFIQHVYLRLFPQTAGVKWILADSKESSVVYGQDSSESRRPVIAYDSDKKLHFIPASTFGNADAIIDSFYYHSSPPYDTNLQTSPTTPTHYTIRDALSNNMLTIEYLDINNFTQGFTLKDGNTYIGSTVVVEFSILTADGQMILYGVPVDVVKGKYLDTI